MNSTEHTHSPKVEKAPIFDWSPLPKRKWFENKFQCNESKTEENNVGKTDTTVSEELIWQRSCTQEILEPISGIVTGVIPDWISGTVIRNGPGTTSIGESEFQHLFDCPSLLHKFHISNGKVTYQSRFLQSETYKSNRKANRIVVTDFGTQAVPDPCQTIYSRLSAIFKPLSSDNAAISVYPFGDELYAMGEIPIIYRIDVDLLETKKPVRLDKKMALVTHSSHPHVTKDGTVYNLGLSIGAQGNFFHNIVCFEKNKNGSTDNMFDTAKIIAKIPGRSNFNASYMHTFGITENYFIIVEQPMSLSLRKTCYVKLKNEPIIGALQWYPKEYTKFNVICKKTGKLKAAFYSEAFVYFHIINQYEIDDHIVIDICCYRDPAIMDCLYLDALRNKNKIEHFEKMVRGRPLRFVLPLKAKTTEKERNLITLKNCQSTAFSLQKKIVVTPEILCHITCDLPRINYEKYSGKCYRFFYGVSAINIQPGQIIKVDTLTKTTKVWFEQNCYASEPIFVPTPDCKEEDDGIILASLLWTNDPYKIGLLVLDAKHMEEIGKVIFCAKSEVPKCFHGWYLENK